MTEHHSVPVARPEVVRAWIDGWVRSRGTDGPVEVPGGFRIAVGRTDQVARYVLPAADPALLRRLSDALITPGLWLSVCAPRAAVASALPEGWEIQDPEYLMTVPLVSGAALEPFSPCSPANPSSSSRASPAQPSSASPASAAVPSRSPDPLLVPGGYVVETVMQGGIIDARAFTALGDAVAGGRVALAGQAAFFDRVDADPAHGNQNLDRLVMTALAARAARHGATQGVLLTTVDGLALYQALGWNVHAPVTAAVLRKRGVRDGRDAAG